MDRHRLAPRHSPRYHRLRRSFRYDLLLVGSSGVGGDLDACQIAKPYSSPPTWKRGKPCLCHSRDVLIRREPRSNPERRSAESVFALQIQPSRRSGLISLLRSARPNIPSGPNVRPAVLPKPIDVGCTRCVLASECIACFASRSRNSNGGWNRNPNRSRADPRQQPLSVDLHGFTGKVYMALGRPKRLAGGWIR